MNKLKYLIILLFAFLSCKTEEPPTQFSEAALNDTFKTLEGHSVTLKSVLEKHSGKNIVIDIWASWCGDCIKGMPKVKALQNIFKDVSYVFLSLDRNENTWKRGIEKYHVEGEHYYMPKGKKGAFSDFVGISWIPRYMVINKVGEIAVFNVIHANDDKLVAALKK